VWLGHLRLYTAGTPKRFATRHGEEDLKQASLRFPIAEARERGRYAFLPPKRDKGSATLPHPRGKVKQTLRFPTGGENSPPNYIVFLFYLGFTHLEQEQRDPPRCDVQRSCTSRPLPLLISRAPYEAAGGWREGPQGNRQGCRFLFVGAGAPSKSPEPARAPGGRSPEGADSGGPFLWVTFLWASKEK
jgi:hypothetical protein